MLNFFILIIILMETKETEDICQINHKPFKLNSDLFEI